MGCSALGEGDPRLWNACSLYTPLPYGYTYTVQGVGRKGLLHNAIADEEYYDEEYYDEYYDDEYYYYEDYWEDEERKEEKIEASKFNEATVLENILDILKQGMGPMMGGGKDVRKGSETQDIQSFHHNEKGVIGGYRTGYRVQERPKERYHPAAAASQWRGGGRFKGESSRLGGSTGSSRLGGRRRKRPIDDDDVQWEESRPALTEKGEDGDKEGWGGLATAGFFGLFLPTLLGSLLYLGVPTAQALFAGASLVTTYLVADRSNPSATAVQLDSLGRSTLIWILGILDSLAADGREGRLVELLPFCVNSTDLYNRLDELGCDADFLQGVLPPGAGILANTTTCREGSLPHLARKVGEAMVRVFGDCSSEPG